MIELRETSEEGRYVVAKQDIPAGALVHVCDPYVLVMSPDFISQRCWGCFTPVEVPSEIRPSLFSGDSAATSKDSSKKATKATSGGNKKMKSANYLALKAQLSRAGKKPSTPSPQPPPEVTGDDDGDDGDNSSSPVVCAECGIAVYCSSSCMKQHKPEHQQQMECQTAQLVRDKTKHRKPEEVHFLMITLQIVLRCASEGYASSLLQQQPQSASTASKVVSSDHNATIPPSTQQTLQQQRVAESVSCAPKEAVRIRDSQSARGAVEVLDATSCNPKGQMSLQEAIALCSPSQLTQGVSSVVSPPPLWSHMAQLVSNVSVIAKDHLADFHTLHRYFLKVIHDAPGALFGLPPPVQQDSTPAAAEKVDAPPANPNMLPVFKKKNQETEESSERDRKNLVESREVITPYMFHSICAALQCNGFGVYNEAERCVAIGSYPLASFFNHSCNPNLCRLMVGRKASFYALTAVTAGTPLCISYTDVEKQTSERRHVLLSTYRFYCECNRCAGSATLQFGRCAQCSARGYVRPLMEEGRLTGSGECTICRAVSSLVSPLPSSTSTSTDVPVAS